MDVLGRFVGGALDRAFHDHGDEDDPLGWGGAHAWSGGAHVASGSPRVVDDGIRWGHAETATPERWSGEFRTREDAIQDGRENYPGAFYVTSGVCVTMRDVLPSATEVLDQAGEAAEHICTAGEDFRDCLTRANEADLDRLLIQWANKQGFLGFWKADGMPERLGPKAAEVRPDAGVALVEREDGRLLAVWHRRLRGWTLPGGLCLPGEPPFDAASRELLEETGLRALVLQPLFDGEHRPDQEGNRAARVHVMRVYARGAPASVEDGCPVLWMTRRDYLAGTPFAEFYERVFAAAHPLPTWSP